MSSSLSNARRARYGGCIVAALLTSTACLDAPDYRFGENVTAQFFEIYDQDAGIHPSTVVLDDPNNLFRDAEIGTETKWDLLDGAGDVAAFYAWATLLARGANGELQYYTATKLSAIYRVGAAAEADLPVVSDMAIRAFQSVLDYFPTAVTYDETGTIAYRLATPAYQGITALGGVPTGGWVLVINADGEEEAVPTSGIQPTPDTDADDTEDDS